MARVKWYGYLLNEQGQVIPSANISVFLAGSNTPANIYTNESGSNIIQIPPQLTTNADGYYEFWIGDTSEDYGYSSFQKFKITWEKEGIVNGYNDFISILPLALPVNVESTDTVRDKSISNNLARLWEEHRTDESFYVHGIEPVDKNSTNADKNKLISNLDANEWERTKWVSWSYVDFPNVDAQSNRGYILDSSNNNINIFLPNSPSIGDAIALATIDVTNTIKIDRNGKLIFGNEQDLFLDLDSSGLTLVYTGEQYGWTIVSEISGISPLDGDVIEISFVPTQYTRDHSIPEAENEESLSAHLKGIDNELERIRDAKYVYENISIDDAFDGDVAPDSTITLDSGNGKIKVRKFSDTVTQDVYITLETSENLISDKGMQFKVISYVTETTGPTDQGVAFAVSGCSIADGEGLDKAFNTDVVTSRQGLTLSQYSRIDSGWSNNLDINNLDGSNTIQLKLSRKHDHSHDTYNQPIGISSIKLRYRKSIVDV